MTEIKYRTLNFDWYIWKFIYLSKLNEINHHLKKLQSPPRDAQLNRTPSVPSLFSQRISMRIHSTRISANLATKPDSCQVTWHAPQVGVNGRDVTRQKSSATFAQHPLGEVGGGSEGGVFWPSYFRGWGGTWLNIPRPIFYKTGLQIDW